MLVAQPIVARAQGHMRARTEAALAEVGAHGHGAVVRKRAYGQAIAQMGAGERRAHEAAVMPRTARERRAHEAAVTQMTAHECRAHEAAMTQT